MHLLARAARNAKKIIKNVHTYVYTRFNRDTSYCSFRVLYYSIHHSKCLRRLYDYTSFNIFLIELYFKRPNASRRVIAI